MISNVVLGVAILIVSRVIVVARCVHLQLCVDISVYFRLIAVQAVQAHLFVTKNYIPSFILSSLVSHIVVFLGFMLSIVYYFMAISQGFTFINLVVDRFIMALLVVVHVSDLTIAI